MFGRERVNEDRLEDRLERLGVKIRTTEAKADAACAEEAAAYYNLAEQLRSKKDLYLQELGAVQHASHARDAS